MGAHGNNGFFALGLSLLIKNVGFAPMNRLTPQQPVASRIERHLCVPVLPCYCEPWHGSMPIPTRYGDALAHIGVVALDMVGLPLD